MKKIDISNQQEADQFIQNIKLSINEVMNKMKCYEGDLEHLFYQLKFSTFGKDPLSDRPLNFIEQVNQSYTYLVSFHAVKYLLNNHGDFGTYTLNLGTTSGSDIESEDGTLIAEVFAATSVTSNLKMQKDIAKLNDVKNAKIKYLFYHTPVEDSKIVERFSKTNTGIKIIKIDL